MKSHRLLKSAASMALSLALMISLHAPSWAEESFTKGKSIRILIGYPPAGGHDLEARIMGRHLGKYLPGKPNIIVQNMPGAGGMIQAGYVYNRAKPDGLTIGLFGGSHGIQALLMDPKVIKYDLSKMSVVWAVSSSYVDIVRDFLNAKTAKDLFKVDPSKIVVAGRSKAGSSCLKGQLALRLLGVEGFKPVCAYKGTAVIRGAMERGEVSFFNASDAHLIGRGAFVDMHKRGMVFPMWQTGKLQADGKIVRSPTVKGDVPTLYEVYKEKFEKPPSGPMWDSWKGISLGMSKLTRILVLPPRTPPARVNTLRKAIRRMAQDPKFVSDWERVFGQKLGPVLVPPEEGEKIKNEYTRPTPWQAYLRKFASG